MKWFSLFLFPTPKQFSAVRQVRGLPRPYSRHCNYMYFNRKSATYFHQYGVFCRAYAIEPSRSSSLMCFFHTRKSSTLKTYQIIVRPGYARGIKKHGNQRLCWIFVWKNSALKEKHVTSSFRKVPNVFCRHESAKPAFSNFSSFEERFRKPPGPFS